MNPNVKAKWVAALRSGKYNQGKSALHIIHRDGREEFCCLGVLCDLYAAENPVTITTSKKAWYDRRLYDGDAFVLPPSVQHWADLDEIPVVEVPYAVVESMTLTALNDWGWPFDKIANLIEEQL